MRRISARIGRLGAAAIVGLALGLAGGCGAMNPRLANPNYEASDGVQVDLGGLVTGENLLILSAEQGGPGALTGAITNRTDEAVSLSVAVAGAKEPFAVVRLAAGETKLLGTEGGTEALIPSVAQPAGATQSLTFDLPQYGTLDAPIPVLDGTFAEYRTGIPTPSESPTSS